MDTAKVRVIFEYEFRGGTNAAETARNVNAVFGEDTANDPTVRFWFNHFLSGNFDLKNEPRAKLATKVNNYELNVMVEVDPSQITKKLASCFDVSIPTILTRLHQICKKNLKNGCFMILLIYITLQDQLKAIRHSRQTSPLFMEAVQNTFTQFVESRTPEFYRKGLNNLPIRWQKCIDNEATESPSSSEGSLAQAQLSRLLAGRRQRKDLRENLSSFSVEAATRQFFINFTLPVITRFPPTFDPSSIDRYFDIPWMTFVPSGAYVHRVSMCVLVSIVCIVSSPKLWAEF